MDAIDKAKKTSLLNEGEAAQLKHLEESESCPTCGGPMTARSMKEEPIPESELGPEQGGKHGMFPDAGRFGSNFAGYRQRTMKRGEKISGG